VAKTVDAKTGVAPSRSGGFAVKLAIIGSIVAALSVLPLCLVAAPGMMPSLAVFFADGKRPRYLSYTVAVMNAAGVLPFLLVVAKGGMSFVVAAHKLEEPFTWLVMYGAAAAGWLTSAATPALARICIEVQAGHRRRGLEALAKAIREEWGDEVAGTKGKAR
jgi:hypothetical protein